jgi:hypothetical protein
LVAANFVHVDRPKSVSRNLSETVEQGQKLRDLPGGGETERKKRQRGPDGGDRGKKNDSCSPTQQRGRLKQTEQRQKLPDLVGEQRKLMRKWEKEKLPYARGLQLQGHSRGDR